MPYMSNITYHTSMIFKCTPCVCACACAYACACMYFYRLHATYTHSYTSMQCAGAGPPDQHGEQGTASLGLGCSRRHRFSKVLFIVTFCSKYPRALTVQNLCQRLSSSAEGGNANGAKHCQSTLERDPLHLVPGQRHIAK